MIETVTSTEQVRWHKPSDELPQRGVSVLCAWPYGPGWVYDVAKWTGKRWLETIPEADNEEFCTPTYWRQIEAPV